MHQGSRHSLTAFLLIVLSLTLFSSCSKEGDGSVLQLRSGDVTASLQDTVYQEDTLTGTISITLPPAQLTAVGGADDTERPSRLKEAYAPTVSYGAVTLPVPVFKTSLSTGEQQTGVFTMTFQVVLTVDTPKVGDVVMLYLSGFPDPFQFTL